MKYFLFSNGAIFNRRFLAALSMYNFLARKAVPPMKERLKKTMRTIIPALSPGNNAFGGGIGTTW